ncbi:MAG: Vitamin B12 import ATP-binding protein BtuD [Myxococcota bacterium]|nr:Vitamin B12 import ATP-binding protein BtuD [Myxococcota bacterium]
METREIAIGVTGVTKVFQVYPKFSDRMRELMPWNRGKKFHHDIYALNTVSFEAPRGAAFGIIGDNGSGKSTLLRCIAGVQQVTSGHIHRAGRISSLLDLNAGFHTEFTGRENIYLNCAMRGLSLEQTNEVLQDIIEFSELKDFIDAPVKTYSTGMGMRLGFSIATSVGADILVFDEVLAVGDQYFMRKCLDRVGDFLEQKRTLLFVSHDLHTLRGLCETVLWLKDGKIAALGPADSTIGAYTDYVRAREAKTGRKLHIRRSTEETDATRIAQDFADGLPDGQAHPSSQQAAAPSGAQAREEDGGPVSVPAEEVEIPQEAAPAAPAGNGTGGEDGVPDGEPVVGRAEVGRLPEGIQHVGEEGVVINSIVLMNGKGEITREFETFGTMILKVVFTNESLLKKPVFGCAIHRNDSVYVHGPNTSYDGFPQRDYPPGTWELSITYPDLPLLPGQYDLSPSIYDTRQLKPYIYLDRTEVFRVTKGPRDYGVAAVPHIWEVREMARMPGVEALGKPKNE